MDLRFLFAKLSSSTLKSLLRLSGSGGTAAPGLIAEYIDPLALRKLSDYVSDIILVTGTNGKTTSSRIIGSILDSNNTPYIHNREGSNLLRGLIGSLMSKTPLLPKIDKPLALLEVDEATLPLVITQTAPRIIVVNNLFRDQLDRYGETETIRKIWMRALQNLDQTTNLVLNSDDPSIAYLGFGTRAKAVYFGIEDKKLSLKSLPHASDFINCVRCGSQLHYSQVFMSHLGHYFCAECKLKRPKADVYAQNIELMGESGFKANIVTTEVKFNIELNLPGLYNVYNALAAISCALALKIPTPKIIQSLKTFEAAFGRTEKIEVGNKKLFIALAKNPAGFNELLRTFFTKGKNRYVFIAVNDLIADGRDVSWLWDVDFEEMLGKVEKLWVSGTRAADMSLRLKYAGLKHEGYNSNVKEALESAYTTLPSGETLFVLPTYTAMLEIKKFLAEKGYSGRFWEE